jgi:bacteriocin-like protein
MTDFNNEVCELTVEELEAVSGGRTKIEKSPFVLAWEIAKIQEENPGF